MKPLLSKNPPLSRLKTFTRQYPNQFWLMFAGMLLSTMGTSMIWPFLMIYVSSKLDQPLVVAASLFSINSLVSLGAAFIAGPIADRVGRKGVLVVSLIGNGMIYLLMGQASSVLHFAVLMFFWGIFNPLYRVGGDAMVADLVEPRQRPDAYALLRMSNNAGIAIGPAIGGFIATSSYSIAFICAAAGLTGYGLLLLFFAHETLPASPADRPKSRQPFEGYGTVFHDKQFITAVIAFTFAQMASVSVWVLMSVYAKTNYGLPESRYGLIAATNAIMVIFFQLAVTQRTKRHSPLLVMAGGTAIYAVASGSVSFPTGFWGFWICMVVMTIGELMLVPTSSTYAANLAPADMRGRYMSIYSLSWGIASGIASPLGGFLNDAINPQAIWYGAATMGSIGMVIFLMLWRKQPRAETLVNLTTE
ncbi:MAG TPA: hypothetical protein DEH25_07775 [Chloroflexi bacterium]|nr:hypothetical protein [Chloroflexota bacterium]